MKRSPVNEKAWIWRQSLCNYISLFRYWMAVHWKLWKSKDDGVDIYKKRDLEHPKGCIKTFVPISSSVCTCVHGPSLQIKQSVCDKKLFILSTPVFVELTKYLNLTWLSHLQQKPHDHYMHHEAKFLKRDGIESNVYSALSSQIRKLIFKLRLISRHHEVHNFSSSSYTLNAVRILIIKRITWLFMGFCKSLLANN